MRHNSLKISLALLILLVSACARQNEVELSLVATNVVLRTEIAQVRETATMQADLLQRTVEAVGTLVAQSDQQGGQLRATLVARGTDPVTLEDINPQMVTPLPMIESGDTTAGIAAPLASTPPAGTGDSFADPLMTEETAPGSGPALTNILMARGVGSDDCALGSVSTFTTGDTEIYVVATAIGIQPGTTITARYRVGDQEIAHSFTPNFAINNNCIWFYMDQTDAPFIPGSWTVQLEINGQPASQPIPFSITG